MLLFHIVSFSFIADDREAKKCEGHAKRPGLYAVCLLLDIDSHVVSQSPAVIWLFDKEAGVKISFKKNTFLDDETTLDFRVTCKSFHRLSKQMTRIDIFYKSDLLLLRGYYWQSMAQIFQYIFLLGLLSVKI